MGLWPISHQIGNKACCILKVVDNRAIWRILIRHALFKLLNTFKKHTRKIYTFLYDNNISHNNNFLGVTMHLKTILQTLHKLFLKN